MNEYKDNFDSVTASLSNQIKSLEVRVNEISSSLHRDSKVKDKAPVKPTKAKKALTILASLIVFQVFYFLAYRYSNYKDLFNFCMAINSTLIILFVFVAFSYLWLNDE